ncbi:cytochrome P450 6k1-like [Pieris napi]|uniref:cytochrome P450 6k1-like n=1 Tax=Pieris napi TaxID=78633 RepID=UPI001FB8E79E|nr:cytochrome P450 6k1-like [Pieris napi]
MVMLQILIPFLLLYICVYLIGKYNEVYWRRRGVPLYKRHKVTGIYWDFVFGGRAVFESLCDVYRSYPAAPVVGVGCLLTPSLQVRGARCVRHVLARDSAAFAHRGVQPNRGDLLADNVLFMHGVRWKLMRQALTPLFTASKLRSMYYIMDRSARDFADHLEQHPELWTTGVYDTLATFCSAAIGAAVFGITPESIFDSPFLNMAQKAFKPTFWSDTNLILSNLSLDLSQFLGIKLFKEHEPLFINAIRKVLEQRRQERGGTAKHDFAELCVALQQAGRIRDPQLPLELEPTDELLAAQAFFFFIAGVEPTASALFAALYELGRHPEHQQRLHQEIDEVFAANNGELSADAVSGMEFLDSVVCEALRLHPPVGYLKRLCIRDSVLPTDDASGVHVKSNTRVYVPVYEAHHDAKVWEHPEQFQPERFSAEKKRLVSEWTYLPFGRGARECIGRRYAALQVKAGLVHVLQRFGVSSRTLPCHPYSRQQLQVRLDNVHLEFHPRKLS